MNKKVVISVALMVVANLTTVFYVNQQMLGMQKAVSEMKGLAIKLPPELESKLKRDLGELVKGVKSTTDNALASTMTDVNCVVTDMKQNVVAMKGAADEACAKLTPAVQSSVENLLGSITTDVNCVVTEMEQNVAAIKGSADEACAKLTPVVRSSVENLLGSITTDVNCVVTDMKQNVADAKESAEKAFAEATRMMQSAILEASSNLVGMCRLKVLGNELEAERSYQKAVQALADGDFALAKLYCMNAINHSPTKKLYYAKWLEISAKVGDETRDDLEQIKAALELGVFQVAADDVLGMRSMLAGVIEKIDNMDAVVRLSREKEEKSASDQALTSLREGDLSYDSVIGANDEERLVLLQRRLVVLRDMDKARLTTNDVAWIEEQDMRTRASLEYFDLVNSIDSYLRRAQKLLEGESSKLSSVNVMVQKASQLLSQAFGIEAAYLPSTAQDKLQQFAKWIEAIEVRFNKIKSEPAIAEIRSLIAKVEGVKVAAPYQKKIDLIEECLSRISQKLVTVFDSEERSLLEGEIKKVAKRLGECRQAQYKAYQSWAVNRCYAGMEKYRSWTRVDIEDAEEVVYKYLIEIDSTLLSPDVARLYHDVLNKQFEELKDHTVAVEIALAQHKKKQLNEF